MELTDPTGTMEGVHGHPRRQAKGRQTMTPEQLSRRIAFLREGPLFADLSDKELATCGKDFYPRRYAKSEIIFHQGDSSRDLYVICEGKVRIFKTGSAGGETSICLFGPHDVIGEFAVIDAGPRSATGRAIEACVLLTMAGDVFLRHMRTMPELALGMSKLLVSKVRWTAAYAEMMAQYDAAGRLLHLLLEYNDKFGEELEEGVCYRLDLSLTQADLATLVGVQREWISRTMGQWRKRGLVEYDKGTITILDLAKVHQERDSRIEPNRGKVDW
jgi:CRP-like cAMP-binding protein